MHPEVRALCSRGRLERAEEVLERRLLLVQLLLFERVLVSGLAHLEKYGERRKHLFTLYRV